MMTAAATHDVLSIDELSQRLRLSVKVLRELAKTRGFPLWRLTPRGPLSADWADVQKWITKNRRGLK